MKRKVIKPNIVSGGVAIPLGDNMYLMRGRKHKNGGIDIGNDPKTGIEVEDGEVMQMTNKGAKIFSAMPLLRGSSPANEVLSGANPNDVFRRQEAYKDRNKINDDGSKKKAIGGGIPPYNTKNKSNMYQRMKDPNRKTITDWKTDKTSTHKLAYATIDDKVVVYPNIQEINGELYDFTDPKNNRGKWDSLRRAIDTGDTIQFKNETDADKFVNNYKKEFKGFNKYAGGGNYKGSWGNLYPSRYFTNSWGNLTSGDEYKGIWGNLYPQVSKDPGYYVRRDTLYKEDNKNNIFTKFFKNKDNVSDLIGVGSNILGSTLSYFRNKSMLKNMQAPIKPTIAAPASYQATKLKTNVNINPQLDTLRNSSAIYNNSVDNNTASSRVALARKQANRMNINNQINSLYGNKENQETELINRDRLQQQQIANQNVAQYNDYLNRKAALDNEYNNQLINFKNTINEKKAENAVSLFSNANAAIQDILGRREQRTNERNTIAAYLASHPDVSPELYNRLLGENNPLFDDEIVNLWKDRYKKKLKPKTE